MLGPEPGAAVASGSTAGNKVLRGDGVRGRKAESVAALGEPGAPRNEGGGASPAAMPAAVAAALTALAALRKTAALSPAEDKGALCSLLL